MGDRKSGTGEERLSDCDRGEGLGHGVAGGDACPLVRSTEVEADFKCDKDLGTAGRGVRIVLSTLLIVGLWLLTFSVPLGFLVFKPEGLRGTGGREVPGGQRGEGAGAVSSGTLL